MRRIAQIILLGLMLSCKSKNPSAQQVDNDLLIIAMHTKSRSGDNLETYMVRIFPDKKYMDKGKEKLNELMQYRSDSSFYLLENDKKIYPVYVEPIANGIKNNYEFIIGFNLSESGSKSNTLIYQDQLINQKKYVLSIQ